MFHSDPCFQVCTVCWRSIWLTLSHPHLNQATQKKQSSICASRWKKHACLCAQMWVPSAGLLAETISSELSEACGVPSDDVRLLQPTLWPQRHECQFPPYYPISWTTFKTVRALVRASNTQKRNWYLRQQCFLTWGFTVTLNILNMFSRYIARRSQSGTKTSMCTYVYCSIATNGQRVKKNAINIHQ